LAPLHEKTVMMQTTKKAAAITAVELFAFML
jgi:hypothetical protein